MVLLKRNSRHTKDFLDRKRFLRQNKLTVSNNNEKLVPPWKISGSLVLLAVIVFLLITHEDSPEKRENREIPNPERSLPPSHSKLYKFKHAAISSDSQACSDMSRKLMEMKSDVFSLSINALVCNSLTNVQSMGLFGGFLMTVHLPSEQKSLAIDAQMTAPANFKLPLENDFSQVKEGPLSIATSGMLKGIWEIYKNYSKIPWHDIIEPVHELCRNGIVLTKHLRDSIEMNARILNDSYFRETFIDDATKRIKRIGSKIVLTRQCDFLEVLSRHNASNDIFSGEVAEILIDDLKSANSVVTLQDLKSYNVKVYEAKKFDLDDDKTILVPNSCAILVPAILNVLLKYNFNSSSFDSQNHANLSVLMHHRIVETFKHVFAIRPQLGDPDFLDVENVTNYLLSYEFAKHVISSINDTYTKSNYSDYILPKTHDVNIAPNNHGTSHISIVADNGDSISVTSSINYYFGSGVIGGKSGLIFNNGMDDFSYENRSINYFGLKETPTNYPEPGKRALSSIAPIIVINRKTQRASLVIGAAGGSKILTSISVVLLRYLCDSDDLKEMIDAPRFHHQLIPDVVDYEFGILNSVIEGLDARGHEAKRYRYRGTIINALKIDQKRIHAISDYRKDASGVAGY